jgi:hypothetical protein
MWTGRLRTLFGHLSPAATADSAALAPVALELGDLSGHVHPSICLSADGTLVVVYATDLDDSHGKDALCCVRSHDLGTSWSQPVVIPSTIVRPSNVRDTGGAEVYSGTLTTMPDATLLLTWQYLAMGDNEYKEGALCYCESSDHGMNWSELTTIIDPANPPDIASNEKRHLGAMRHGKVASPAPVSRSSNANHNGATTAAGRRKQARKGGR